MQLCVHPENVASVLPGVLHQLGGSVAESSRVGCGAACALAEMVRIIGPTCHPETFLPVWTYLKPALEQPEHMAKPFVMKCVASLVSTLGTRTHVIIWTPRVLQFDPSDSSCV
jgi:hypothetical protein